MQGKFLITYTIKKDNEKASHAADCFFTKYGFEKEDQKRLLSLCPVLPGGQNLGQSDMPAVHHRIRSDCFSCWASSLRRFSSASSPTQPTSR